MPDKPKAIAVNLSPSARVVIEGIRQDIGVPNTEAMTRLLEWFASLDRPLRTAILTRDADAQRDLLGPALARMALLDAYQIDDFDTLNYQQLCDLIEAATGALEKQIKALRREVTGKVDPERKSRK